MSRQRNSQSSWPSLQRAPTRLAYGSEESSSDTAPPVWAATRERREEKPTPPQWWNVVLLDDDDHTYEYVIQMVTTLFRVSQTRALELATKVDKEGRAVLLTTHKEHAELKREQVHSWGADAMLQRSASSMAAV